VIAQLAGVALRAVEIAGVEQRIDELEQRTAFMPGRPG
jgi:hypothetical protein